MANPEHVAILKRGVEEWNANHRRRQGDRSTTTAESPADPRPRSRNASVLIDCAAPRGAMSLVLRTLADYQPFALTAFCRACGRSVVLDKEARANQYGRDARIPIFVNWGIVPKPVDLLM